MSDQPTVQQRDIHFDLSDVELCNWHGQGAHVSLFFNALSPFFPEGEKFFIRSVRRYADDIADPILSENVQGFIGQEAMHGREHREYNKGLVAAGLPADKVERFVINDLRITEKYFSDRAKLAMTIALEHLTAIMASVLLSEPRALDGSDPKLAKLWRWHAIEETEHKAVAFDVYRQVAPGLSGYLLRCAIMLMTSLLFSLEIFVVHLLFCWRAGVAGDFRGWARCWWFLWGSPGLKRRAIVPWLAWFKPGFHPWQDDNRYQIDRWKAESEHA
ncbi:MAG: metal-dependent hydrolase [Oceanococcus sp.]